MQGKLIVIQPSGNYTVIDITSPPDLNTIQKAVGGLIETIPGFDYLTSVDYAGPCVAFCNEEGKLTGLPLNPVATLVWVNALIEKGCQQLDDHLVGPVAIVCGDRELLEAL